MKYMSVSQYLREFANLPVKPVSSYFFRVLVVWPSVFFNKFSSNKRLKAQTLVNLLKSL